MFHKCQNQEDVKKLYRQLSMFLHPDKGGDEYLMHLLTEAKEQAHEAFGAIYEFRNQKNPYHSVEKEQEEPYQKAYENVEAGDPRLKIIDDIQGYAKDHPKFNPGFVNSIEDYLQEHFFITSSQYNSLIKSYYAFRMHEWREKN